MFAYPNVPKEDEYYTASENLKMLDRKLKQLEIALRFASGEQQKLFAKPVVEPNQAAPAAKRLRSNSNG